MKLRFKNDGIVNGEVVFEAGKTYEISNETGSADRWIKRGAEVVEEVVIQEDEIPVVIKEEDIVEVTEVDAIEALGSEVVEEVVIQETKKENKAVKEKKPSKGK